MALNSIILQNEAVMLKTRYEEYKNSVHDLPFVLSCITRTPNNLSKETNWHENLEIQLCTKGEGTVTVDGKKYNFVKGDIIVVNSNTIHYTGTDNFIEYTCLIIDSQFCKDVDIDHTSLTFEEHFQSGGLSMLIYQLERLYECPEDPCRIAKLCIAVLEILIELKQKHLTEAKPKTANQSFEVVKECIRYIRKNYNQKIYIDDLADFVLTDKYKLSRSFKLLTNQTIIEYINCYRCLKVTELINDGLSVSESAMSCGFNNMSFFTRTFKRYMGTLPSKTKKRQRE